MKRLLVVDAGNSRVKCALWHDSRIVQRWSFPTAQVAGRIGPILQLSGAPVALASVVPPATEAVTAACAKLQLRVLVITSQSQKFLPELPLELGADLACQAVAGSIEYAQGKLLVVVGFGTANTLMVLSPSGKLLGGWLAPGISVALTSLHEHCALLPSLSMVEQSTRLGTDTESWMRNGVFTAQIGLAREWLAQASRQLTGKPVTIATGGWSGALQASARLFDVVDQDLVLSGAYMIAQANNVPAEPNPISVSLR